MTLESYKRKMMAKMNAAPETKVTCGINKDAYASSKRFLESFYDVPCQQLAKNLLGHILVRKLSDGTVLRGKIVETECYPGGDDRASHSYQGKFTERNAPMYMKPGTAYVYFTYGMYNCFNISSQGPGAAVLLRAFEPIEGMEYMLQERMKRRKNPGKIKHHELGNGPSKICMSMNIDKESCNARNMCSWDGLWVEEGIISHSVSDPDWLSAVHPNEVVTSQRIGIDSTGHESVSKLYRFYILGNPSVSKRDKIKENELDSSIEVVPRKMKLLVPTKINI
ncbi:hypothetical protein J437_LFUL004576 [Ladona fulva]|uniref:DNA-3-methyladenine glycosylase n=1 Tax=Ladona fulva TaxID=123851 RepID=A0A8K0JVA6_LADFU|nr:hypothetical protein J437_LFUL004576 [Ladona fulva]